MKHSRKKTSRWLPLSLLAEVVLGGALLLVACNRTVTKTDSDPSPASPVAVAPQILSPAASPTPAPGPSAVTIYTVKSGGEGQHLESLTVPPQGDSAESAVTALNRMSEGKQSPLPDGTRAISVKFGADGVATADFNAALKDNFKGGDEKEALMLNAILATVGQFPDVKKVQILVEGQKVAIGGTQDTTEPLDVPAPVGVRVSKREGQP